MNHHERQLMRLLHGELTPKEAARLEADIERDDALRTAYERLAATWQGLELPDPEPAPIDFARVIKATARQQFDHDLSWARAPIWVRTGAAVALTAGMTLGLVLGGDLNETLTPENMATLADSAILENTAGMEDMTQADFELDPLSLAEIYWLSIDDHDQLFSEPAADIADSSGGSVR